MLNAKTKADKFYLPEIKNRIQVKRVVEANISLLITELVISLEFQCLFLRTRGLENRCLLAEKTPG